MNEINVQKIFMIYELFNDFNRIRILVCLDKEEKSIDDISQSTGLSIPIVSTQLDYLESNKIVLKREIESENKDDDSEETIALFKIKDKTMIRIIDNIIKYTNKLK